MLKICYSFIVHTYAVMIKLIEIPYENLWYYHSSIFGDPRLTDTTSLSIAYMPADLIPHPGTRSNGFLIYWCYPFFIQFQLPWKGGAVIDTVWQVLFWVRGSMESSLTVIFSISKLCHEFVPLRKWLVSPFWFWFWPTLQKRAAECDQSFLFGWGAW